jgi:hypothetical protein
MSVEPSLLHADLLAAVIRLLAAAWFVATILMNVPGGADLLASHSRLKHLLSLIPNWSFFAPNPVTKDLALMYRDRLDDGAVSPWREIADVHTSTRAWRFAWNPNGRPAKAVSDACNRLVSLLRQVDTPRPERVFLSVPYLLLLNRVSNVSVGIGVCFRQFALVRHASRGEEMVVIFVSNFHEVNPRVDLDIARC